MSPPLLLAAHSTRSALRLPEGIGGGQAVGDGAGEAIGDGGAQIVSDADPFRADETAPLETALQDVELTPAEDPGIEGGLVAIVPEGMVGWAWRPAQPHLPVAVIVQANGFEVGRAVADRLDDDIVKAHGHPGVPGFCIRLERLPGGLYPLALTLHDVAGGRIGGPFMVADIGQLIPVTDAVAAQYEGSIDGIVDGVIFGWARNAALPDLSVTVELLDGGKPAGRMRADVAREDLRAAGKGSGRHGYRMTLSNRLLDGRAHSLRVRIGGTKFELPNGPIAFGPLPPGDPMEEIHVLRAEVRLLAERIDALSDPSGRYLGDVVRRLSERVAALAEVHRESIERELDALRRFAFARAEMADNLTVADTTPDRTSRGTAQK